ncbi:MAG: class I SAM-dependent methyltransferase [Oceanidesulfovibrio sp.]
MDTFFDVLRLAHEAVARALEQADSSAGSSPLAVDATVGNGHDSLFLARSVGGHGMVFGFDLQQRALDAARMRLTEAGVTERVALFHASHEHMAELLPAEAHGRIRAVMFNLGYLPGADKSVVTTPQSTVAALDAALSLLAPGGVISITAYPSHPGGAEETQTVRGWCAGLDSPYKAMEYGMANRPDAKRLFLAGWPRG